VVIDIPDFLPPLIALKESSGSQSGMGGLLNVSVNITFLEC